MIQSYLSDTDIAKRYRIARPTVWRWHRECAGFPRAIKLSSGCTRWRLSEIEVWEAAQEEVAQ